MKTRRVSWRHEEEALALVAIAVMTAMASVKVMSPGSDRASAVAAAQEARRGRCLAFSRRRRVCTYGLCSPQAAGIGCAGFAAFSVAIDAVMHASE